MHMENPAALTSEELIISQKESFSTPFYGKLL